MRVRIVSSTWAILLRQAIAFVCVCVRDKLFIFAWHLREICYIPSQPLAFSPRLSHILSISLFFFEICLFCLKKKNLIIKCTHARDVFITWSELFLCQIVICNSLEYTYSPKISFTEKKHSECRRKIYLYDCDVLFCKSFSSSLYFISLHTYVRLSSRIRFVSAFLLTYEIPCVSPE